MNKNKTKTQSPTSALLIVSPQDVGLLTVSDTNLPSLLAVPADDQLLITGSHNFILFQLFLNFHLV